MLWRKKYDFAFAGNDAKSDGGRARKIAAACGRCEKTVAPLAMDSNPVALTTSANIPTAKVPTKPKVKDFTAPGVVKPKPAKKESFLSGVDSSDMVLIGLGAAFFLLGIWLRFGAYVDGMRPYRGFGIIAIIIGVSMLKAGWPGREHWRDDF